jgi:mono/diheme cytochrome c family protein
MMKKVNSKISGIATCTLLIMLIALASFNFNNSWVVPANYTNMKNPTDPKDKEGLRIARALWAKHCQSCHGKTGLGDGTKAAELKTDSGDFSLESFHKQTDGDLYYKTTFGRDEMPAYDKRIPSDEDRWLLVNYMRTFAN